MTYTVEIQDPEGKISKAPVNKNVFEILGRLHLPPYAWSELIDANLIDAGEMERVKNQHYSSGPVSNES